MKTGEKGIHLARIFNYIHGIRKEDDRLPDRMFEPLLNGSQKGAYINRDEFYKSIRIYYEMMGWDKEGKPTLGKFAELGIEEYYS